MRRSAVLLAAAICAACSADHVPEPWPEVKRPGAIFVTEQSDGAHQLAQTLAEVPITRTESAFFVKTFNNRPSSVEDAARICREEPLEIRSDATFVGSAVLEEATVVWFITLTEEDLAPIR